MFDWFCYWATSVCVGSMYRFGLFLVFSFWFLATVGHAHMLFYEMLKSTFSLSICACNECAIENACCNSQEQLSSKMQKSWLTYVLRMICSFFSKGNLSSIMGIQNVLKAFYTFSGLQLNCAKSELFSTGVSRESLMEI